MYRESTQKRPNVRPKVFGIWLLSWFDVQPYNKIKDQIEISCFSYFFLNEDIQDASSSDFREILEPTMAPYLLSSLDLWVINLVPLNFGRCEHPIGQAIICSFIWASENINTKKTLSMQIHETNPPSKNQGQCSGRHLYCCGCLGVLIDLFNGDQFYDFVDWHLATQEDGREAWLRFVSFGV